MPNQLKEGTERVSYVESSDVHKALKILSIFKGVSISALMRVATSELLKKEDPTGVLLEQARRARQTQSDISAQRAKEKLPPELLKIAQEIQATVKQ